MNPAARVYDPSELKVLADWCRRHDVVAVCDEVWEHVAVDGRRHTPLPALPGMGEGRAKIGSAGAEIRLASPGNNGAALLTPPICYRIICGAPASAPPIFAPPPFSPAPTRPASRSPAAYSPCAPA